MIFVEAFSNLYLILPNGQTKNKSLSMITLGRWFHFLDRFDFVKMKKEKEMMLYNYISLIQLPSSILPSR